MAVRHTLATLGASPVARKCVRVLRRFAARPLVLLYHRVAQLDADPFGLAVTPAHFAEHMQVLRRCFRPMALQDLCRALESRSVPRRTVAVTFDDGYADNLHQAKPLLEGSEIPATVFVVAGRIGGGFWWDDLTRILLPSRQTPDERQFARIREIAGLLRPMPAQARAEAISALAAEPGCGPAGLSSDRAMTADEVAELAAGTLFEVGAHTWSHPFLPSLDAAECRTEIGRAKACLERILGRAVTSFAYPYGAFGPETVQAVRAAGFERACTVVKGPVRRNADLFLLPRVSLKDCDGDVFERWLRQGGV